MLDAVLDLVLPRSCVGCGRPGVALCRVCAPVDLSAVVGAGGLDVVAAGTYADGLRQAVLHYKERGRRDLARALGALLAAAVRLAVRRSGLPSSAVVLVAVPSSRAASAARGGDHLARLARHAAARSGVRVAAGVLCPTRAVLDSAGLVPAERAVNLHGALRARPPNGRVALLVDDVVTTGATLREGRRALRVAGWQTCGSAVVAATPRRVLGEALASPR